ncbi:hypothetical protein O181_007663 [Austropuccinia psidii MF-1]|uniref:Uncharacterized protein n=1 Tax=Austropuccinia psidii MF-1 TaxID=1389203 RepID=A0A9Q3GHT3_9BASI|nr:hypothetical protein [Austropuccinia psidii MF-1]
MPPPLWIVPYSLYILAFLLSIAEAIQEFESESSSVLNSEAMSQNLSKFPNTSFAQSLPTFRKGALRQALPEWPRDEIDPGDTNTLSDAPPTIWRWQNWPKTGFKPQPTKPINIVPSGMWDGWHASTSAYQLAYSMKEYVKLLGFPTLLFRFEEAQSRLFTFNQANE